MHRALALALLLAVPSCTLALPVITSGQASESNRRVREATRADGVPREEKSVARHALGGAVFGFVIDALIAGFVIREGSKVGTIDTAIEVR